MRPSVSPRGVIRPWLWPVLRVGALALLAGTALLAVPAHVLADEIPATPPTPLDAIVDWGFDASIQVPALLTAALYLGGVWQVWRRHPDNPVPWSRVLAFLAGLAVIEYALQGPVDRYEAVLFSDHMLQHFLLMIVAAPLLVMGAPITLLLRVASPRARTGWILPILHSRPLRLVSHPIVASILYAGVLWGTHFSFIYEPALTNDTVHNLEHLAYLTAALLFWWPMLGRDPSPWRVSHPVRLAALLIQMAQGAFLGVAIMNAQVPLYAYYAGLHLPWMSTMADQQLAGAIMWGAEEPAFLVAALVVIFDWMRAEEQATARLDARLDREEHALGTRGAIPVGPGGGRASRSARVPRPEDPLEAAAQGVDPVD